MCRKLLDPGLGASCRQSMFLNLLYKSLKADVSLRRVKAFAKRLLHVSAGQSAGFACGALFLLSEVMKAKPSLRTLLQQDEVTKRHLPTVHTSVTLFLFLASLRYCKVLYNGLLHSFHLGFNILPKDTAG